VSLIAQSGAVIRTGQLMLESGTASYRVKQAMRAVARSVGIDEPRHHVSFTELAATSRRGRIFRTEVAEAKGFHVNVDRIMRLDRFRRTLPPRASADEIHGRLDTIAAHGSLYPSWAFAVFAGLACAAFAVLNRALPFEVAVVFVAAFLGQVVRRALVGRHFNLFGAAVVSAAVASVAYLAGVALINVSGEGLTTHAAGYISSVLFLLPGFALITGALDMANMDLRAGIERIAYGTMITMAAGVSVWAVSLVGDLDTVPRAEEAIGLGAQLALWFVATGVGVLGFALLFNSPWRLAFWAAGIGAVANTARLFAVSEGIKVQAATALACLAVGCLAALVARGGRYPHITLSVPAVLVMIPGVAAHQALMDINAGDYTSAIGGILMVVLVVLAIMVGLVGAKLITDKEWAFGRTEG
jgi:uncharacterized membrane protein YjjP (DUF1212 family)